MATTYTDGNIILDAFTATIATQSYIFNDFTVSIPVIEAERNAANGTLAAKRTIVDLGRITATGTIQISETAQNQDLINETFTVPAANHYDNAATTYVIEGITLSNASNESRTATLTCRRSISANA